ncbi:hypothetical protein [Mucilaginibacter xinganensis]|uniref:Uncharacterized protein n=1 Tax=Mucilaginibacter xinganensis TaxID=1234841 RepID=A0A223P028_9SPHI|nr:hypothetical protein [Mucilaginibacter xinganensis]ASU35465.1 hypothetical protein MuYL_3580 [Mucilaginibacter xinganensis]
MEQDLAGGTSGTGVDINPKPMPGSLKYDMHQQTRCLPSFLPAMQLIILVVRNGLVL